MIRVLISLKQEERVKLFGTYAGFLANGAQGRRLARFVELIPYKVDDYPVPIGQGLDPFFPVSIEGAGRERAR